MSDTDPTATGPRVGISDYGRDGDGAVVEMGP